MARKLITIEGPNYIGHYPHDIEEGWRPDRNGLRRKLASVADLNHLEKHERNSLLKNLYYQKEQEIRKQQARAYEDNLKKEASRKKIKIREALKEWVEELRVTNSEKTLRNYMHSAEYYLKSCGNHPLSEFKRSHNIKFMDYLQSYRKANGEALSPVTISKHIRHFGVFLNWAYEHDLIPKKIKLKNVRVPQKDMDTLDIEKIVQAMVLCKEKEQAQHRKAEKLRYTSLYRAMMVAKNTLLRAGSIWSLPLENIDLNNRIIKIRPVPELNWHPKGILHPDKPINDELYRFLKADFKDRNPEERWYLDKGDGEQWRKDGGDLSREAAKFFKEIGYPKIKPFHHGFRSALITHLLVDQKLPISIVQHMADHSTPATTAKYLDSRRISQKEVANLLSDLGEIIKKPSEE